MSLVSIEQELLASLEQAFKDGDKSFLKTIDSLPGEFDEATVRDMISDAPAAYILFLGGKRRTENKLAINSHWAVYTVTDHAGSNKKRRHGDARNLGSYEILERCLPALEATKLTDCGHIEIGDIENLFSGKLNKRGVSAYCATFSFSMPIAVFRDASNDGRFVTYHSDHLDQAENLPVEGDHPQNTIEMEQA